MLQNRIIPALQIQDGSVVKSIKFKKHSYIGDPVNTVNIFNSMEVDEILILDVNATNNIKYDLIEEIATECFMPLAYGGGIGNIEQAKKIFELGVEKIVIGEHSFNNFKFLNEISEIFGSQSIVVSMDIKKTMFGKYSLKNKKNFFSINLSDYVKNLETAGVGEILLTSVDNEGTFNGLDLDLISLVSEKVTIPIIAAGGVGSLAHVRAGKDAGASAVATGSMAVFQNQNRSVLINFPKKRERQKYGI